MYLLRLHVFYELSVTASYVRMSYLLLGSHLVAAFGF